MSSPLFTPRFLIMFGYSFTVFVSLFQTNSVALRAERFVNWKRVNTNAVKYLTATAWPAPAGASMMAADTNAKTRAKE